MPRRRNIAVTVAIPLRRARTLAGISAFVVDMPVGFRRVVRVLGGSSRRALRASIAGPVALNVRGFLQIPTPGLTRCTFGRFLDLRVSSFSALRSSLISAPLRSPVIFDSFRSRESFWPRKSRASGPSCACRCATVPVLFLGASDPSRSGFQCRAPGALSKGSPRSCPKELRPYSLTPRLRCGSKGLGVNRAGSERRFTVRHRGISYGSLMKKHRIVVNGGTPQIRPRSRRSQASTTTPS